MMHASNPILLPAPKARVVHYALICAHSITRGYARILLRADMRALALRAYARACTQFHYVQICARARCADTRAHARNSLDERTRAADLQSFTNVRMYA